MQTTIIKEADKEYLEEKLILEFIEFLFEKMSINKELELNILFSNDKKIEELNRKFKNKNEPTNILSFYGYSGDIFGDIIISVETMEKEALQNGDNIFDYMLFLISHGFLHLAGYTHETIDKYDEMINMQNNLVKEWKNEKKD